MKSTVLAYDLQSTQPVTIFHVLGMCTASELRNVEYSILLVMSELSIVRCDRALGLWIAGTWASSVDGELLWR